MERNDTERLLTVQEMAEHLGYSVRTVYDKVQRREIPHLRMGRTVRFRLSEVTRWLDGQTAGTAA